MREEKLLHITDRQEQKPQQYSFIVWAACTSHLKKIQVLHLSHFFRKNRQVSSLAPCIFRVISQSHVRLFSSPQPPSLQGILNQEHLLRKGNPFMMSPRLLDTLPTHSTWASANFLHSPQLLKEGLLLELCHYEGARLWHNSFIPKLTAFQINSPLHFWQDLKAQPRK